MKKLLAIALPLLLAVLSVRADLIWYEGFQYTNGSLAATTPTLTAFTNSASQGIWLRESGSANPSDMYVVNSNLQVTATGGGAVSRQDDCCRFFATTNGTPISSVLATYGNTNYDYPQVLYASFTLICSTTISNNAGLPNGVGTYFASFYSSTNYGAVEAAGVTNANGYGYFGRVQAFTNGTVLPNTWRIGVSDNASSTNKNDGGFPVDLAVNTPYQVVEEIDPITLQAASIWVNPINPNQSGNSPVDRVYTASDSLGKALLFGVNSYAFRQASSFGAAAFIVTNLAVASTFAEAMTNVAPTNAVAPVIVYQPVVGITNFVNASITLSAVANGQGLGNMTYQWQQNGTNYTGGNGGTANILAISSAQASDSGNYTLIATTPYGLSVTSSVSKVLISVAPVPPSFATGGQPVSQTVYGGQSVIFSTTVISPGNVTFTWYSNNVVVTTGTQTSGETSTLELDNVTTNFSGSVYKVAATNDVVTTSGIVSTNAVLTVLSPSAVSIAYLRTLVDPSTYQPTNSTTPYQITGTVTTFTNTTSGNTSSYFLQDATAGINIFATFGSTFRPAQGDVVTFIGVLSYFSTSGLELYADTVDAPYANYTSYTDTGVTNALPTPIIIPFSVTNNLSYVNTNLAGSLVTITNVYFGTNAGTTISTSANESVTVTNASGQTFALQFFDLNQDTAGQTLPAFAYSVTGVLYGGNPNFSVGMSRFADIVTTASLSPIPLNIQLSGANVVLTWSDASFNLQSSTNVVGPYSNIPAAVGLTTYTDAITNQANFYRLKHP